MVERATWLFRVEVLWLAEFIGANKSNRKEAQLSGGKHCVHGEKVERRPLAVSQDTQSALVKPWQASVKLLACVYQVLCMHQSIGYGKYYLSVD